MTTLNKKIELTNIEEELQKLWDLEQGKDKIRACLFNLIVYLQEGPRAEEYQETIRQVVSKFPCRILLIQEKKEGDALRTHVGTETVGEGELQIFCDQIFIDFSGSFKERVASIVLPEILPDLPVYLFWTEDPVKENSVLPALERFASRVLFDPSHLTSVPQYSAKVLQLTRDFHSDIRDLGWAAISGWRSLFRSTFDSPKALSRLFHTKKIEIQYSGKRALHALYLQGWLASSLGWEPVESQWHGEELRIQYKSAHGDIEVVCKSHPLKVGFEGRILQVQMDSTIDDAHYSFKRAPNTRQVYAQSSDCNQCDLPTCQVLSGLKEGEEIIEEIFYAKPGTHYTHTLETLAKLKF